jgi:hypothetical protein
MHYFLKIFKNGYLITVPKLSHYPRGMSRFQLTYEHAIWVAEWFLRKIAQKPKSSTSRVHQAPLKKRFPTPRAFPPQAWGNDLASRIAKI